MLLVVTPFYTTNTHESLFVLKVYKDLWVFVVYKVVTTSNIGELLRNFLLMSSQFPPQYLNYPWVLICIESNSVFDPNTGLGAHKIIFIYTSFQWVESWRSRALEHPEFDQPTDLEHKKLRGTSKKHIFNSNPHSMLRFKFFTHLFCIKTIENISFQWHCRFFFFEFH